MRRGAGLMAAPGLHITKQLGDIVKLPLFRLEEPTKARDIWLSKDKPRTIHGVMTADEFSRFRTASQACPNFILPVPRPIQEQSPGYFNVFLQFQHNVLMFTSLAEYQQDRNALPYLVVAFFDELLTSHKMAFLRGDIVSPNLTKDQAAEVILLARQFYLHEDKFRWVKTFNERPREFDYDAFTREFRLLHRT
eukprot:GEMP01109629.1.p1 GENE.GEMP01109629.1~~GEMP01109629.1.p1  ORF type:complete len:205 (+),score=44.62 GEMP01109629.1:37-615(+)